MEKYHQESCTNKHQRKYTSAQIDTLSFTLKIHFDRIGFLVVMFHLIPYWNTILRTFCCNYNLILVGIFFSFSICFFFISLFLDSSLSFLLRTSYVFNMYFCFFLLSFSFTLFQRFRCLIYVSEVSRIKYV